jgi:hypothetical protein
LAVCQVRVKESAAGALNKALPAYLIYFTTLTIRREKYAIVFAAKLFMKKLRLLFSGLLLLTSFGAAAQIPYNVTTMTNQAYQPLTGATSINGSTIWDDDIFSVAMPFNFTVDGQVINRLNLDLSFGGFLTDTSGIVSGFTYGEMDLIDKGQFSGSASLSPIHYVVSGAAPNRIMKVEIANAGFYDDTTATDRVNI